MFRRIFPDVRRTHDDPPTHLLRTAARSRSPPSAPVRAAEKTRITLWHAMSATLGEEINKLIAAFNASQDQVEVTGLFKGVYKDLMTSVAAAWRAGQAPHIAQVFEVGTQTMLSSGPVIKPVWQLAQDTGVKLDPNAYIPAVRGYYSQPDGKLMSMPFNSSTCIVWYNKDAFEKGRPRSGKVPGDLAGSRDRLRGRCATKGASAVSGDHRLGRLGAFRAVQRDPQSSLRHRGERLQRPRRGAEDQQPGARARTCSGCWTWRRRARSTTPAATAAATARSSAASPA